MFDFLKRIFGNSSVKGLSPEEAAAEFLRQAGLDVATGNTAELRRRFTRFWIQTKTWNPGMDLITEARLEEALQKALLEPLRPKRRGAFSDLGSLWPPRPKKGE